MARTITYSIVGDWQLPETVVFSNTGLVEGYFTSLTGGSEWQTSTNLGSVNRNTSYTTTLAATPQAGATIVNYAIRGEARLPLGLYLNSATGQLSGTVDLWPRESAESEYRSKPIPVWSTVSDLGVRDELDVVNLSFVASPMLGNTVTYSVASGYLPWGLNLKPSNGELSGTLTPMEPSEEYLEKTPKPVIDPTTFGAVSNGSVVNYSIQATAPSGQTIANYSIHSGILPWGLRLNPTTGAIIGTVTIPSAQMPTTNSYTFEVRVTTNTDAYSTASFTITIA